MAARTAAERGLGNAEFSVADVGDLPFGDGSFDLAHCVDTLACVADTSRRPVPRPVHSRKKAGKYPGKRRGRSLAGQRRILYDSRTDTVVQRCNRLLTTKRELDIRKTENPLGWGTAPVAGK